MADLNDIQAAQTIKIAGVDSSGLETNYVEVTSAIPGTSTYGQHVRTIPQHLPTYSCAGFLTPAGSPTDMITISGSNSKKIRINRLLIRGTRTSENTSNLYIIKRSTANTGGTSTSGVNVPRDSTNGAATAVVTLYTANPATLGTTVGTLLAYKIYFFDQSKPSSLDHLFFECDHEYTQEIVLNGSNEHLSINLNGVATAGLQISYYMEWTEE